VNGAFAFCPVLEQLAAAIEGAKRVVWVQNDYTIIPPKESSGAESPFRKAFVNRRVAGKPYIDYWTTVRANSKNPGSHLINWNCLTFDPDFLRGTEHLRVMRKQSPETLLYYGSYRSGRRKYFDRFFQTPSARTVISCPNKKFENAYHNKLVEHVPAIRENFHRTLSEHGLGLYIEDKKSHSEYHSPANRFYEMLSAGLPMVFQAECGSMMRAAGYNPEPHVVTGALGVERAMPLRASIAEKQHADWYDKARAEKEELPARLHAAWKDTEKRL
jgi:hypothetical protein